MSTLKDLIAIHGFANANEPQEKWVKFTVADRVSGWWFAPFFYDKTSDYYRGDESSGASNGHSNGRKDWSLWTPPKKKIKMEAWSQKYVSASRHIVYRAKDDDRFIYRAKDEVPKDAYRVPSLDYEVEE